MHHEELIDRALISNLRRTAFVYKSRTGEWKPSITLPTADTYFTITPEGEVCLVTPDDPKPIRVRAKDHT